MSELETTTETEQRGTLASRFASPFRSRWSRLHLWLAEFRLWGRPPETAPKIAVAFIASILLSTPPAYFAQEATLDLTYEAAYVLALAVAAAWLAATPLLIASVMGMPSSAERQRLRHTAAVMASLAVCFSLLPTPWLFAGCVSVLAFAVAALAESELAAKDAHLSLMGQKITFDDTPAKPAKRRFLPRRKKEQPAVPTEVEPTAVWTARIYLGLDHANEADKRRLAEATRSLGGPHALVALWKEHGDIPGWVAACEESAAWFASEADMVSLLLRTSPQQLRHYSEKISSVITDRGDVNEARRMVAGLYRTMAKYSQRTDDRYLYLSHADTFEPPPTLTSPFPPTS